MSSSAPPTQSDRACVRIAASAASADAQLIVAGKQITVDPLLLVIARLQLIENKACARSLATGR